MSYFAYIDAGTGSMFIQAIFGVILASTVFLRGFFSKSYTQAKLAISRQKAVDEEV